MIDAYCALSFCWRAASALASVAVPWAAGAATWAATGLVVGAAGAAATVDGAAPPWACALFQNRSVFSVRPSLPSSLCQLDSVSLHLASTWLPKSSPQLAGHLVRSVPCASRNASIALRKAALAYIGLLTRIEK